MEIEVIGCINCPFCHWEDEDGDYNPYCWLENSINYLYDYIDTGKFRGSYPETCRQAKEEVKIKLIKI